MTRARPAGAVFFGSGDFAVPILLAMAAHPAVRLAAVVSTPDRPAGRGGRPRAVPVARLAREHGWPLVQPARLRDGAVVEAIVAFAADVFVLADYGRIVPPELVDAPPHGALNVHPSLLPRHRGASPVAATIIAGDAETGVTIIRMDAGIDTGPIVAQERTPVGADETAPQLEGRLAALGADLLRRILEPWLTGTLQARPQPARGASTSPVLGREDGRLDWDGDAATLERRVRALQPWPGTFTGSPIGRLVVWRSAATVPPTEPADVDRPAPGTVVPAGRGLAVTCRRGVLELLEVQLAGRRRMSGQDLRNGHPELVGARLG
jgi:methionyl-tRNA formyltransferase